MASSSVNRCFHELLSSLVRSYYHNKPIMNYKLRFFGQDEEDTDEKECLPRKYSIFDEERG